MTVTRPNSLIGRVFTELFWKKNTILYNRLWSFLTRQRIVCWEVKFEHCEYLTRILFFFRRSELDVKTTFGKIQSKEKWHTYCSFCFIVNDRIANCIVVVIDLVVFFCPFEVFVVPNNKINFLISGHYIESGHLHCVLERRLIFLFFFYSKF